MASPPLRDLQDLIDWVVDRFNDLQDRTNELEDSGSTIKLNPLVLKKGEAIQSQNYGLGSRAASLVGKIAGFRVSGTGELNSGTKSDLGGYTTFTGTADFRKAKVLGLGDLVGGEGGGGGDLEIVFSQPAAVDGVTSPPWTPPTAKTLTQIQVLVATAPTSSLTVTVLINGSASGSVTLGTGATSGTAALSAPIAPGARLQVSASAGSGAQKMAAIVRYA